MHRLRASRDPYWDVDGAAVRRERVRQRILGGAALAMAIAACGLTTAVWLRELAPLATRIGLG
jgi:hypothetical protein